jgi:acetyl esterase
MRPHDPRYTGLASESDADVDASLTYVMMAWPVLDPYARYLHARRLDRTQTVAAHDAYFGGAETMQEASPQHILERGEAAELPPALIAQGAADDTVAPRTAERFAEAYAQAGGLIELALFPGVGHGFAREEGPNTDRTIELMQSFVFRQLAAIQRA